LTRRPPSLKILGCIRRGDLTYVGVLLMMQKWYGSAPLEYSVGSEKELDISIVW
jgi:hypothetical protein